MAGQGGKRPGSSGMSALDRFREPLHGLRLEAAWQDGESALVSGEDYDAFYGQAHKARTVLRNEFARAYEQVGEPSLAEAHRGQIRALKSSRTLGVD